MTGDMTPGRLEHDERGRIVRNGRVLDAPVRVDGFDEHGRHRVSAELPHGVHPADLLRSRGWEPVHPVTAERAIDDAHGVVLAYVVAPLPGGAVPLTHVEPPVDPGVELDPACPPLVRTRIAAYALVVDDGQVLLTTSSGRTNAEGAWGLPGGGVEPGEEPAAAAVREVWEETGQEIKRLRLADVLSQHWVGYSPKGVLEDFQAVRVVYRAALRSRREVVVHDVDGTTASAAWVPLDEVPGLRLAPAWRDLPSWL